MEAVSESDVELGRQGLTLCAELRGRLEQSKMRISITEHNLEKKAALDKEIALLESQLKTTKEVLNKTKEQYKATVNFLVEKKQISQQDLNEGLERAHTLVPHALPVFLHTKENSTYVATKSPRGVIVEYGGVEGSGLRSGISLFLRASILNNTGYQQFMWLDEPLAKMSAETSLLFAQYLPLVSEDMLIILIEQKPEVFSTTIAKQYYVNKYNEISTLEEEALDHGVEIG